MRRNLVGYFAGLPDCTQYSVKIISDDSIETFEEIYLAADSPFVVSYDTSNTPFEPIRYSRGSINVVADEKFFDVFSKEAQGTKVILTNEDTDTIEWVGYLTNNLIQMPDNSCGAETFTLEAKDCISTLEHYDYQGWTSAKTIVTFSQLLAGIANRCGQITDLYVDMSLMRENNTYISMDDLTISEQNFYSSDTDEPWNYQDVLSELCKYLGYTAMQKGSALYLVDLQAHTSDKWSGDTSTLYFNFYHYKQENLWASYVQEVVEIPGLTLRQSIIRGTGSDISLETLYNKVQVKDSFYEIDHFIPDIYDDSHLTNRQGDFWKCNQIAPGSFHYNYLNKNGKVKSEEKKESDHIYYIRKFDHDWYDYIYRDVDSLDEIPVAGYEASGISVSNIEANIGASGTTGKFYELKAIFTNHDDVTHNISVTVGIGIAWYDFDLGSDESQRTYSFTLASGENYTGSFSAACNTGKNVLGEVYTNHMNIDGGPDIEIQGGFSSNELRYISSCVVDLATFDKPMDTNKYLYETESDISFDRYIMLHTHDKPVRMHPHSSWMFDNYLNPLHDSEIEAVFPSIMKLSSGYTNPMIIDDNAYLALNAKAIYERYEVEYMNPDWTHENTSTGWLGLFGPVRGITTIAPCLIFKLKIGDKYWSSELNQWTTTEGCFVVDLGTDKADNDNCDFTEWWNEEHPVLNNISWTDWAGLSGYKIPLEAGLDFSQPIEFSMMMPSKMQKVEGHTDIKYNEMCWVKDLGIEFTTKDAENYNNADVIYENIIDSGSVNTLSDISCRFTTYPGQGMHSYSSVALDGVLMNQIVRLGLDNVPNKAEENIIKAYSNMYSSPTVKENLTINLDANQMSRIYDPTINRYFTVLGGEIDYAMGSQRLTIVQTKEWNEKTVLAITISAVWQDNVPLDGGFATSGNCNVTVTAEYDDGTTGEVTNGSIVSGYLYVEPSDDETPHTAGTLTLTAEYMGFSAETEVVVYQSLVEPQGLDEYLTLEIISGGTLFWGASPHAVLYGLGYVEYSTDGGITWLRAEPDSYISGPSEIDLQTGDVVLCKSLATKGCCFRGGTAVFNVKGNIMSMCYGDDFSSQTTMKTTHHLFGETNVVDASKLLLPATTLSGSCYDSMFFNCRNLISTPSLPAKTLEHSCYTAMFQGCTSLKDYAIPSLPAKTLVRECYTRMFAGCTGITSIPYNYLPVKTMKDWCYEGMFHACTSLTTAPALPAETLAGHCYDSMFYGCTSLTTAPELPATTLVDSCYYYMFKDCTNLNYIKCLAAGQSAEYISAIHALNYWVENVSPTGTFVKNIEADSWQRGISGIPNGWDVEDYTLPNPYLTFTMMGDGEIVCSASYQNIEYSKDGGSTWTTTNGASIPVSSGDTVYFRGDYTTYTLGNSVLTSTAPHNISGKIMSMLSGGVMTEQFSFSEMFRGDTGLISAADLILPNNVTPYCYSRMFYDCTSLTTAPVLPARSLVNYCYNRMFDGCSNLNYVKCNADTNLSATNCLQYWLRGVSSSGTFVKERGVTYPSGGSGIPSNWTIIEE